MMALSKKMVEHEPNEIELLLPWYAAGTLNPRDMKRVEDALARDPALARQYAEIQGEYAETIALNETLGAPSLRAMQKLFAAIDAEPAQSAVVPRGLGMRILGFFDSLSPRTLAWSGSAAALLVLVQAGVIGAVLMRSPPTTFQTASLDSSERAMPMAAPAPRAQDSAAPQASSKVPAPSAPVLTRALGPTATAPVHALVRFVPEARIAEITALLDQYQASIIDGAKGGLFKLQIGDRPMSKEEADGLIGRLQREKIVNLAVSAP
jgi:anti-sigma factor RsiW